MKLTLVGLLLVSLLGASACRTTTTRRLAFSDGGEIRTAQPTRAWEVATAGETVGLVVFFEAQGPTEDSVFMVRNVWHQDLGLIDAFGRAYRYVPHSNEPSWVGSGTVEQGVERILGRRGSCALSEIPLPVREGAGSPGEREQRRKSFPNPLSPES